MIKTSMNINGICFKIKSECVQTGGRRFKMHRAARVVFKIVAMRFDEPDCLLVKVSFFIGQFHTRLVWIWLPALLSALSHHYLKISHIIIYIIKFTKFHRLKTSFMLG